MGDVVLIPAAGRGSRLGSSLPKALVSVNGATMLEHLFRLYDRVAETFVVVVSPAAEAVVRSHCSSLPFRIELAVQREPTGMLDAILVPHDRIDALDPARVWVTWCDQVAIHPRTVARVAAAAAVAPPPALALPTVWRSQPYIHLERDDGGRICRVLHQREGDPMPSMGESDMGLFNLSADAYLRLLPRFAQDAQPAAGTGERNFLPFIAWLPERDDVVAVPATHDMECVGINTADELERVAAYLRTHDPAAGVLG